MTDWRDEAGCRDKPGEWWFPEREGPREGRWMSQARVVCAACPVSGECLDFAISEEIVHGMWGGKTPEERRRMMLGRAG